MIPLPKLTYTYYHTQKAYIEAFKQVTVNSRQNKYTKREKAPQQFAPHHFREQDQSSALRWF